MTSLTFILLSGGLSFGVPMALAVRELLGPSEKPWRRDEPPSTKHVVPVPPKPLPDCLLPVPMRVRACPVRVLEDA